MEFDLALEFLGDMYHENKRSIKLHTYDIKIQTTPRYSAEHREGEADAQGARVQRTRRHHPGPAGEWASGQGRLGGGGRAGVRMVEAGRESKGPMGERTLVTIGI